MYKEILLAVDHEHEESWRDALPVALAHCKAFGSRLHVLTVVQDMGPGDVSSFLPLDFEKKVIEKTTDWLHRMVKDNVPADVKVQHIVGAGKVYSEILRVAREIGADLIVMGAHNPGAADFLLGSNASRVAGHADRSVLIVREAKKS